MGESAFGSVHIRLMPSRGLLVMLAATHAGGAACLLACDLPAALQWAAAVAVVLLGVRSVRLHATGRAGRAIVHLGWGADGTCRLTQRDGRLVDAVVEHGSYSHPALVALALRDADGRLRRVLVVPERTDLESFRRLRVRLRCERAQAGGDDRRAPLC